MTQAWFVLLGAIVGAAASMGATIATLFFTNRNERRRLAVEVGFREWEIADKRAAANAQKGRGAKVSPPALFVYFNSELIRLLDKRKALTAKSYRALMERSDAVKRAIDEAHALRAE